MHDSHIAIQRLIWAARDRLPMMVVYDHPTDYPDFYVARLWWTVPEPRPVNFIVRAKALAPLHEIMESAGLAKIARRPHDDPAILETWL